MSVSPARIALFMPSFRGGGMERSMINLAQGLQERGRQVDLIVAETSGVLRNEVPERVRVIGLQQQRVLTCLIPLARYLSRERPAFLISALTHCNTIASLARILSGGKVRLIATEHNYRSLLWMGGASAKIKVLDMMSRRILRSAHSVVAVSQGIADELKELGIPPNKIRVIANPLIDSRLLALAHDTPEHPWLANPGVPVIVTVGRLVPVKDHATLLRAFALLRQTRMCRLVILGEGPLRAQLEQLSKDLGVAEDVSFPGFVSNPFSCMSRAAVFVLPSRNEGLPNVLIEAMASGVPVMCTDCGEGPRWLLRDGARGRLVPIGNPAAMSAALAETMNHPPERVPFQELEEYSISAVTLAYLDLMESL